MADQEIWDNRPFVECEECQGWWEFSTLGIERTLEEVEAEKFVCFRCIEMTELRRTIAEMQEAASRKEDRAIQVDMFQVERSEWQEVKKGIKAATIAVQKPSIAVGNKNNRFSVLQDITEMEAGEDDAKEVVVIGSSNVKRINPFISRKKGGRVKVAAFSGAVTSDLQGKIKQLAGKKNTKIFLHVGTNDTVKRGSEETINNLCSLIQEAKEVGAEVAVCSIPSRTDDDVAFSRAEGINNRLQGICRTNGAEFVDLRGYLVSCKHWRRRDGVHYNIEGARVVGRRLGELIDSFLD